MSKRVNISKAHPRTYEALAALNAEATKGARAAGLSDQLAELVKVRVSQINGCAYCLKIHNKDALKAGVSPDQLAVLPAWRESDYFSAHERAALHLSEAITDISHGHVTDDVYVTVAGVLSDEEISAVSWLAIAINNFNRVAITSRYRVKP